jgi:hypothetical protein
VQGRLTVLIRYPKADFRDLVRNCLNLQSTWFQKPRAFSLLITESFYISRLTMKIFIVNCEMSSNAHGFWNSDRVDMKFTQISFTGTDTWRERTFYAMLTFFNRCRATIRID